MAFEAILLQQTAKPSNWRRITFIVSIALHAGLLAVGVVHSLWQVDELPMPSVDVTLAVAAPPPPPPPPPKRASKKPKTKPSEPKPQTLVAPKEVTKPEPEEDKGADEPSDADEEGDDNGQEGGVAGGVVGGVVGGVAPPPPKKTGPELLTNKQGHGLLAINPQVAPYKVNVPERYIRQGMAYVAVLQVCVGTNGAVRNVRIVKPTIPPIDQQLQKVIPKWRYKPHLVNGVPTEFCYPVNYTVK